MNMPYMPKSKAPGVNGNIILSRYWIYWISSFNSFAKALAPLGPYHIKELEVMFLIRGV